MSYMRYERMIRDVVRDAMASIIRSLIRSEFTQPGSPFSIGPGTPRQRREMGRRPSPIRVRPTRRLLHISLQQRRSEKRQRSIKAIKRKLINQRRKIND